MITKGDYFIDQNGEKTTKRRKKEHLLKIHVKKGLRKISVFLYFLYTFSVYVCGENCDRRPTLWESGKSRFFSPRTKTDTITSTLATNTAFSHTKRPDNADRLFLTEGKNSLSFPLVLKQQRTD